MGWFSGAASFVSGLFSSVKSVGSFKPFLIIVGILIFLLSCVSVFSYILWQRLDTKRAELENCASQISLVKSECANKQLDLTNQIGLLALESAEAMKQLADANRIKNEAIEEALKGEREKNKVIIEQAKREKDFKAIWRRLNTLLN